MKSFILKLIIALSIFTAVTYMSVSKTEAVEVQPEQLIIHEACADLLRELYAMEQLLILSYTFLSNLDEWIVYYNSGVTTFNQKCTPMFNPLGELN